MQGLKDIKGLIHISSNSLYVWMGLTVVLMFLVVFYFFKIWQNKALKKRKKPSVKELAYNKLKNINFSDAKESAYNFTQNFIYFLDENNYLKFKELEQKLEIYKYKNMGIMITTRAENNYPK